MDNEKIIELLQSILAELQKLNAHADKSQRAAGDLMKEQQQKAEKIMGAFKQHIPKDMAEAIFGGSDG